jgi:hypothetical protein
MARILLLSGGYRRLRMNLNGPGFACSGSSPLANGKNSIILWWLGKFANLTRLCTKGIPMRKIGSIGYP